jgi:hypothetical protein
MAAHGMERDPGALSRRNGFSTRTRKASESALAARRMVNGSQTGNGLEAKGRIR